MSAGLEKARELLRLGRPEAAAKAALEHLGQQPESSEAQRVLALAAVQRGELRVAVEAAERAVSCDPTSPGAHHVSAIAKSAAGDLAAGLASIERAIELDPDGAAHHGCRARLLLAARRLDDAYAAARTARALAPDATDQAVVELDALTALGRHAEVAGRLPVLLAAAPDDPAVQARAAAVALRGGDADAAIAHYLAALRRVPDDDACRRGLLEALRGRNRLYRPILWLRLRLGAAVARRPRVVIGGLVVGCIVAARLGAEIRPFVAGVLLVPTALSDLALLLHPVARHALTTTQKYVAVTVGAFLVLALGLAVTAVAQGEPVRASGAGSALVASVLVAVLGFVIAHSELDGRAKRRVLIYLLIALALVGLVVWQRFS